LPQPPAQRQRYEPPQRIERRSHGHAILYAGLAVVVVLFVVSWVMLDLMRCDFFYSDLPFSSHHHLCR
jgi:hypothetical protein